MGELVGNNLNCIIQNLLNNDEFLLALAKQIKEKGFLDEKNKETNLKDDFPNQDLALSFDYDTSQDLSFVEMSQKNNEIEKLKEKILSLKNENNDLKNKIENLNQEKSDLIEKQSYIEIYKKKIEDLEDKQNKLSQENREYESILLKKDEEIEILKNKNKSIEYDFYELKTNYKNLSTEHKNLKDINKNLEDENKINSERYHEEVYRRQTLDLKVRELNELNQEKEDIILLKQNEITKLSSQFSSIKKSYNLFLNLETEIKDDIVAILKGNKIENFVYAGVQYKNIEAIWEYAKNRAVNRQIDDLDKLQNIVANFLDAYNMIYNEPIYKIQDVSIGDEFDEEKFIRGYNSKISGMISDIDLVGYVNLITGKIVKKSVVRV